MDAEQDIKTGVKAGARKAALRLAGVADADRQWILARLSPGQRQQVVQACDQLDAITGEARLDFQLFLDHSEEQARQNVLDIASLPINQVSYAEVKPVLQQLPDLYAAVVVYAGLWQDGQRYLRACSGQRRQSLAAYAKLAITPAVARTLAAEVALLARGEEN